MHVAWVEACFADAIAAGGALVRARLIGVTGVELWSVLRAESDLSPAQAREAMAGLIRSTVLELEAHDDVLQTGVVGAQ